MANRPPPHTIGDQGVAEVARILTNAGWTCETVKADYGEDLICQTSYEGTVDPHRILVQVKSTQRTLGKSGFKVRVKKNTLLKWLSDANIVILSVWSIADRRALYTYPAEYFDPFAIDLSAERCFSITVPSECVLDQQSADKIAWITRFRNINRHFLETVRILESMDIDHFDKVDEYKWHFERYRGVLSSIVTRFLVYVGLLRREGRSFVVDTQALVFEALYLGAGAQNKENISKLRMKFDEVVLTIMLLRARRSMPDVGLPEALLERALGLYSDLLVRTVREGLCRIGGVSRRRLQRSQDGSG
ncbi:MAG: DUF4365 domain-containing protein [Propylenella sp.]